MSARQPTIFSPAAAYDRAWRAPALFVLPLVLSSCGKPEIATRPIRTSELPAQVSVPAGKITVGVQTGTTRFERSVAAFSISRAPITVADYGKCVGAGVCGAPAWRHGACASSTRGNDGYTFDAEPAVPEAPVTCVSLAQAAAYCDWAGAGRLPTSEQWALAARGPAVARYAWGSASVSCDRHFRVGFGPADATCCQAGCDVTPTAVGQHPMGASPYELSDVLITRGELIGASADAGWAGCRAPYLGCIVNGYDPGAIDSFTAAGSPAKAEADTSEIVAAFRCVWEGAS